MHPNSQRTQRSPITRQKETPLPWPHTRKKDQRNNNCSEVIAGLSQHAYPHSYS